MTYHTNRNYLIGATLAMALLTGCASTSQYSGDVYRASDVQVAQNYRLGTIEAIRQVQIQADSPTGNLLGTVGGAVIGGLIGNQVGGGSGRNIATAIGAIGGGAAGAKTEQAMNRIPAWEMEIRMDDGQQMVMVQKADREFNSGQRVRLVGNGAKQKVVPY